MGRKDKRFHKESEDDGKTEVSEAVEVAETTEEVKRNVHPYIHRQISDVVKVGNAMQVQLMNGNVLSFPCAEFSVIEPEGGVSRAVRELAEKQSIVIDVRRKPRVIITLIRQDGNGISVPDWERAKDILEKNQLSGEWADVKKILYG